MSPATLRARLLRRPSGRLLLAALSGLYGLAVFCRNLLFRLQVLPSRKLGARIVCIGNITAGGTGKTSAVLAAAQALTRRQMKTAILSRGYKRLRGSREVQVLLSSHNVSWRDTGDEPWMMHQALKGLQIPILVSPDRCRAAEAAIFYYSPEVILLDDGFQHRRLQRDLDIVLINALDPFGGGRLLPYGDLREPLSSLRRAGLLVITHTDEVPAKRLDDVRGALARHAPGVPIIEAAHRPDFVLDIREEHRRRLAHLKGKQVCCFSGIGSPDSFEGMLRNAGAHLAQCWRYPDHHPYTLEEMRSIENLRQGMAVVTTFKDFPRLPEGWQAALSGEVFLLSIKMEIVKGSELWEEALCGRKAR